MVVLGQETLYNECVYTEYDIGIVVGNRCGREVAVVI
jgi:hypothetical protein